MKSGFCAPAVDETVILLHHPLPLAGVSTVMERERQQNDSLVHGQVAVHDVFGAKDLGWHTATFNLAAPGESPTAHSPPLLTFVAFPRWESPFPFLQPQVSCSQHFSASLLSTVGLSFPNCCLIAVLSHGAVLLRLSYSPQYGSIGDDDDGGEL